MASIESLGHPIVYKVADTGTAPRRDQGPTAAAESAMRVRLRALEGMQKEAAVSLGSGAKWRMVCDEGPYLNGTDLAPFPLAFFTAGQQFDLLSAVVAALRAHSRSFQAITLTQDNYYAMNGSFLRGDAVGSAKSPDIRIQVESGARADEIQPLLDAAARAAPSHALFRDAMKNQFSLTLNGEVVPLDGLGPCPARRPGDSLGTFDTMRPAETSRFLPDLITKTDAAQILRGVEGGAGSSLQPEQKRVLHIRGVARLTDGMIGETEIQLVKPIGSGFRFACDVDPESDGDGFAPPPLAYVSAGIGFCYMTQLGRYAHIAKLPLGGYRLVQDNNYLRGDPGGAVAASARPVDTHVFVDSDETAEAISKLARIGEQTCFLHAAMRGAHPTHVRQA